jgi:IS5 family transposase
MGIQQMVEQLVKGMTTKLYADRGYISQELKSRLRVQGVDLIIYHRKNMKSIQLLKADGYHLKKQ